jgi:hypothetical protein
MKSKVEWQGVVARLERSGLSVKAFAEREGLVWGTLCHWRTVFRREARGSTSLSKVEPQFVELVPVSTSGRSELVEVVLTNGRTVRVAATLVDGALARVIAVAERA